jgi:hypothetical protein
MGTVRVGPALWALIENASGRVVALLNHKPDTDEMRSYLAEIA